MSARRRNLWHRPTLNVSPLQEPTPFPALHLYRYPHVPAGISLVVGRRAWIVRWLIPGCLV